MAKPQDRTPVDHFVDLFVYAPVGLMLEYQDVLPKLIKRGRSQVQIARFFGTMAARKGQQEVNARLGDAVGVATGTVARGITDVGSRVGLAPEPSSTKVAPASKKPAPANAPADTGNRPLPIAGYDNLTAKEIVGLLPDLTAKQREQIRRHESTGRGRKTVLAKIDALAEKD